MNPLPFGSSLKEYENQAAALLQGWAGEDPVTIKLFREHHPRFLDERITWLPKNLSDAEVKSVSLDVSDARLAVARCYSFQDWSRLAEWVTAIGQPGTPIAKFEAAVEAVITGDLDTLDRLLEETPALTTARSTFVTCHDPPVHGATLLHYVAANGVEGFRQKTPKNAVLIAKRLLDGGADPDALAWMYGGQCTTMSMLVSSSHPAEAGVQVALVDTLVDYGAAVNALGTGNWTSPLMTALVFGFLDAAQALVRRGARVDTLAEAAGLGQVDTVRQRLASTNADDRHRALALAAQLGQVEIVRLLLDAGEDPNRYNPDGFHSHGTPLHHAALAGHDAVVRLLVERGARLDIKDTLWQGTPLGWAKYGGQEAVASYLTARGATRD